MAVWRAGGRGAALQRLGLDPGRRTCLIFWGGVGSGKVVEAGRAMLAAREPLNLIFLCGRNTQVRCSARAQSDSRGASTAGPLRDVVPVDSGSGCWVARELTRMVRLVWVVVVVGKRSFRSSCSKCSGRSRCSSKATPPTCPSTCRPAPHPPPPRHAHQARAVSGIRLNRRGCGDARGRDVHGRGCARRRALGRKPSASGWCAASGGGVGVAGAGHDEMACRGAGVIEEQDAGAGCTASKSAIEEQDAWRASSMAMGEPTP